MNLLMMAATNRATTGDGLILLVNFAELAQLADLAGHLDLHR